MNVPCAGGSPAYLEIDKLPDGTYRATVGTLFEHQEVCRTRDLEALVTYQQAFDPVLRDLKCVVSRDLHKVIVERYQNVYQLGSSSPV